MMVSWMLDAEQKGHLEKELEELKKMTPKPMNVMLNKQPRDEAIKKRNEGELWL